MPSADLLPDEPRCQSHLANLMQWRFRLAEVDEGTHDKANSCATMSTSIFCNFNILPSGKRRDKNGGGAVAADCLQYNLRISRF